VLCRLLLHLVRSKSGSRGAFLGGAWELRAVGERRFSLSRATLAASCERKGTDTAVSNAKRAV
jgi:hypothetical protein